MLKTFFVYAPFAFFLVAFTCFLLRSHVRVRSQAIWAMVLLLCHSKFLAFAKFGGDAFTPELPEAVIWLWDWAYSGAIILSALALATVFFRLRRRIVILPILAWTLSAVGVWNGVRPPTVEEVTVKCPDLPPELDGYRILQLSDLHVSSAARRWRTERIVELANAQAADLIVLTGDLVDGNPRERLRDMMPLKDLRARDGVLAVTGNHENYFDFFTWMNWYDRWGIRFLCDDCAFPRPGLAVGGIDDGMRVRRAFNTATNGEFRVLLQHRPKGARQNADLHGVRLQLSGHTHGGVMPLMDLIVRRYNHNFVRGLYVLEPREPDRPVSQLYVSPGAGQWAGFPVRFLNPTRITVLKLVRSPRTPLTDGGEL